MIFRPRGVLLAGVFALTPALLLAEPPAAPKAASAAPLPPAAAAAAVPGLNALGAAEAPGARAESPPFASNFTDGQTLAQPFVLQAGKCYTVVAVGMGVKAAEIQIVSKPSPMLPETVLAQSVGAGPNAVLGGKAAGCFTNPVPLNSPAKVVIKATGSGMIAAQILVK